MDEIIELVDGTGKPIRQCPKKDFEYTRDQYRILYVNDIEDIRIYTVRLNPLEEMFYGKEEKDVL